jgi:uncharacterized membrane protein
VSFDTFEFLWKLDDQRIVTAIAHAELQTSGEIRVYVAESEVDNPVSAAEKQFEQMGMTATRERNGVLIYIAPRSRKFAIIGDTGVHARCGQSFWNDVALEMRRYLKDDRPTDALVHAISKAGELLKAHFPRQADDVNELPDAVQRGV